MLKSGFTEAENDKNTRMLAEAKVDAESLLAAIQAALEQDGDLLNAQEKEEIKAKIDALQANIHAGAGNTSAEDIRKATEALNAATEDFAAKRMDASVSRALAGKSLENLKL
jgi:molecular chaperone HscA